MSFSLRQRANAGPEVGPTSFNFCRALSVTDTGLGRILRPEARKLLVLADEGAQVFRHNTPKPKNTGLGMRPRLRHSEGHLYHPIV